MAAAPAWVYLLRCGDGSLYAGWTTDVDRRVAEHASGRGGRYTSSHLPVALAAAFPMPDASAARREEARIKRLRRPAKEALVQAQALPSPGRPQARSGGASSTQSRVTQSQNARPAQGP